MKGKTMRELTIGERIRGLRREKGMTQKQLADAIGIDDATIRKYESGKLNPKIETIEKIAEGLGVQPDLIRKREPGMTEREFQAFIRLTLLIIRDALEESPNNKSLKELQEIYQSMQEP